jgi:predicted phage tail protein
MHGRITTNQPGGITMSAPGDQIQRLGDDVRALIQQEVKQGQAEMADKARQAAKGGALLAGAGVLGAAALGTSTVLLVRLLDRIMPPTAAAAAATAVLGGAAAALAAGGVAALEPVRPLLPQQTLQQVDDDVRAARHSRAATD